MRKPDMIFVGAFAAAGAILLLFVLLPLSSTLLGTSPGLLWDALADADVLASLGLTFYAAGWATVIAGAVFPVALWDLAQPIHIAKREISNRLRSRVTIRSPILRRSVLTFKGFEK